MNTVTRLAGRFAVALLVTPACAPSPSAAPTQPPRTQSVVSATPSPGASQPAHPQLGGTEWNLTEVDGAPVTETAWISFWRGPHALGQVQSECSVLTFDYTFDEGGASIFPIERTYQAAECSEPALARDARIRAALARIVKWRMPSPEQFELVDDGGATLFEGRPFPPAPTAPPGGDCDGIAEAMCLAAAAQAFNSGLSPEPGQGIITWRVRETIYSSCDGSPAVPKFDVTFELADPAGESTVTIADLYGGLYVCTY